MKLSYLVGTLAFLAIVNIVAVDTYLYYKLVLEPDDPAVAPPESAPGAGGGPVSKLDATQRKEIRRIKKEFRDETGSIYGRIREIEDEMYRLVQEDPVSQVKIERNLTEHGELRLKLKRIAIAKMIETRSILTAEQREELFKALFRTPPKLGGMEGQGEARADSTRTDRRLRKLTTDLGLSPEQARRVRVALEETERKLSDRADMEEGDPEQYRRERKSIMDEEDAEVMKVLTDEQRPKYLELKRKGGPPQEKRPPSKDW